MADRSELEALFVAHLPLIDRILTVVGRRQGLRDDDQTDFASWARLRLIADDYAVLRRFRGESALGTYLTVVLTMAAREYRVAHWGRWRPSAAARARGPLAMQLETLVHRDGLRLADAAQLLRTAGETDLSDRALAALLAELPVRDASARRAMRDGDVTGDVDALADDSAADEPLLRAEAQAERARIEERLSDAVERLPAEERVLVRLRYWKGLSVADAARALGVPQKPLYRRLERAVATLRVGLLAAGVSEERVRAMLVESLPTPPPEPRADVEPERDESRVRPSIRSTDREESTT